MAPTWPPTGSATSPADRERPGSTTSGHLKIPPRYTKPDVVFLKDLVEAGRYRAVIDRTYPLDDVVEATRYVETEHKTGNVVLTVG